MAEPEWRDGCDGPPGTECPDCVGQRAYYGYTIVNGVWVRTTTHTDDEAASAAMAKAFDARMAQTRGASRAGRRGTR